MMQRLTAVALCAACGLCAPVCFTFAADGQPAGRSGSRPAVRLVQNRSRSDKDAKKPAGLPGFGAKTDRPAVSGFGTGAKKSSDDEPRSDRGKERKREERSKDRSREDRPREGGGGDGGGSGGRGGNDDQAKTRNYAQALLRQYDQNQNGVLERDEWQGKMRNDPEKADANGDGRITLDELTVRLASYGKERGGSSSESSSSKRESPNRTREPERPASGNDEEKPDDGPREPGNSRRPSEPSGPSGSSDYSSGSRSGRSGGKARRFLTPTERLPEGLPSFFARCDADADGQVTMAEFASGWSESKVAEFNKYDLDGDGVIAPAEALRAEKNRK